MNEVPTVSPAKTRYRAVFISPHLDDAVFSCGGLIAHLVEEGPVLVINIFTRYLSEVKLRGVVLSNKRYQEEAAASSFLGFESRNLDELDVSFRRNAYRKLGNIFRPPVIEDIDWLPTLREKVLATLTELDYQQLYVPLGVGWHVDHVLAHRLFDAWEGSAQLLYYEDAPYCCIPHSTRYRLNEIASYAVQPRDKSLATMNATWAWWQAAMAYADTALMKNLQPWIVRKFAVPTVSFYLARLMSMHRTLAVTSPKRKLTSLTMPITVRFDTKVDAMSLYASQFHEFFSSREDCVSTLAQYSRSQGGQEAVERYWMPHQRSE